MGSGSGTSAAAPEVDGMMRRGPRRALPAQLAAERDPAPLFLQNTRGFQRPPWCPVLLSVTSQAPPRDSCLMSSAVGHPAYGKAFLAGLPKPKKSGGELQGFGRGNYYRPPDPGITLPVCLPSQSVPLGLYRSLSHPHLTIRQVFPVLWACLRWTWVSMA